MTDQEQPNAAVGRDAAALPPATAPVPAPAPAPVQILRMLHGSVVTQLLAVAAQLGLADLVQEGPCHVSELARRTGSHPEALHRVLRALASVGVFTEAGPRVFAMTPLAGALRTGVPGSMRAMAAAAGREPRQRALAGLASSVRTGRPAFDEVYGTDFWTYLAASDDAGTAFYRSMSDGAEHHGIAALRDVDLSDASLLVDVGGGHGELMAAVLRDHPTLRGVLLDRPEVVAGAVRVLAAAGVGDRARVVAGDFFRSVPSGDAYLLSGILHDWEDRQAVAILASVRRAMRPGGRVLVIDMVLPASDAPHLGKLADIAMLALLGGRERTEAEFASLFRAAGLRHGQTRTTSELSSVLVAYGGQPPDGPVR